MAARRLFPRARPLARPRPSRSPRLGNRVAYKHGRRQWWTRAIFANSARQKPNATAVFPLAFVGNGRTEKKFPNEDATCARGDHRPAYYTERNRRGLPRGEAVDTHGRRTRGDATHCRLPGGGGVSHAATTATPTGRKIRVEKPNADERKKHLPVRPKETIRRRRDNNPIAGDENTASTI